MSCERQNNGTLPAAIRRVDCHDHDPQLREAVGHVSRYALGGRSIRVEGEPLQLDPFAFGNWYTS